MKISIRAKKHNITATHIDSIGELYAETDKDIADIYEEGKDIGDIYHNGGIEAGTVSRGSSTIVTAAEGDSQAKDELSNLEADFGFLVEGLEKMIRDGSDKEAYGLIVEFSGTLSDMISKVSDSVTV